MKVQPAALTFRSMHTPAPYRLEDRLADGESHFLDSPTFFQQTSCLQVPDCGERRGSRYYETEKSLTCNVGRNL